MSIKQHKLFTIGLNIFNFYTVYIKEQKWAENPNLQKQAEVILLYAYTFLVDSHFSLDIFSL